MGYIQIHHKYSDGINKKRYLRKDNYNFFNISVTLILLVQELNKLSNVN